MMRLQVGCTSAAILGASIAVFVSMETTAHHGPVTNPALYQAEDLTELEGVITDVFWRNPHPRFRLSVRDDSE